MKGSLKKIAFWGGGGGISQNQSQVPVTHANCSHCCCVCCTLAPRQERAYCVLAPRYWRQNGYHRFRHGCRHHHRIDGLSSRSSRCCKPIDSIQVGGSWGIHGIGAPKANPAQVSLTPKGRFTTAIYKARACLVIPLPCFLQRLRTARACACMSSTLYIRKYCCVNKWFARWAQHLLIEVDVAKGKKLPLGRMGSR